MKRVLIAAAVLLALGACKEERAAIPQPVVMTEDALGHYCQMALSEHDGPKGQVHLAGSEAPLFFSQVRDAIAYQRMPEQTDEIVAIYVTDMSHAPSWQNPGNDNWMAAADAYYVVGSDATGGMGAEEIVPFSVRADAEAFAARHGGQVVRLDEIPDTAVLAPVDDQGADDDGYLQRLKAASQQENG